MTATLRRPSWVTLAALAIIAAQLVVRGVLVSRSWFLVDDYFFMGDIAQGDDDLAWYLRLHQGHFMPLSFLMVKLVTVVGDPFVWAPVAVQIVLLQAAASLACWWMLRTLFGPGRAALVGLAVYVTTALTMPSLMWWAVAINQYPHQVAFFGAITAHVLFARTGRLRWVGVATLFLLVGYTTYAKTGLVVVTLGLLTLVWLVDGPPWDRFWSALRRFWVAWAVYGAVSLAWVAIYVTRPQERLPGNPTQFLELAQAEFFRATVPTFLGGPWTWKPFVTGPIQYADPPVVLVVAAVVVVALALVHAWGTRERALLVLWPLGAYLLVSAVLVYTGRALVVSYLGGAGIGIHVQYIADVAPLALLAGVSLFAPVLGVADPSRRRERPLADLRPPRTLLGLLLVAVVAGGLVSSVRYADLWRDFPERAPTQRAIAELESVDRVALADVFVPSTVLSAGFGRGALIDRFFAPLSAHYTTSTADVDLRTFDDRGRLRFADVEPVEGAAPARDLKGCRLVGPGGRRFTLEPPPVLGPWLAIDYESDRPGTVSVGGIGVTRVGIEAPAGEHRLLVAAPRPRERIVVTSTARASLCITRVAYGLVEPG